MKRRPIDATVSTVDGMEETFNKIGRGKCLLPKVLTGNSQSIEGSRENLGREEDKNEGGREKREREIKISSIFPYIP